MGTESGLRFIYYSSIHLVPGTITLDRLEGHLAGSITAHKIQYKYNDIEVNADKLTFHWLPAALFTNHLIINDLHAQSLKIKLPVTEKSDRNQPVILPRTLLPMRITLKDIVIDDFKVSQPDQEFEFKLKKVQLDAGLVPNQINIKSLALKMPHFELVLKGKIYPDKNYKHKLNLNWQASLTENENIAEKNILGTGLIEGDLTALKINQQVSGFAQLAFQADVHNLLQQRSWHAEANILDFNPAKLWPDWPGQLKGKLTSDGQTKNDQLNANINITNITGTLRDYPISLSSRLNWINSSLDIKLFEARSGKTQLSANGQISSSMNVNWNLTSNNLSELYPQAQGQLHAKGTLTGEPSTPEFNTTFDGKALSLSGYKINTVKGSVALELFSWEKIKIQFSAKALNLNEYELKSVDIHSKNHTTQITARSEFLTARFVVKDKFNSPDLSSTSSWQGRIEKADFISTRFNSWKLESPSFFSFNKNNFFIDPLCWNSTNGSLCAALENNTKADDKNKSWLARLNINNLPLMAVSPWLPPDLKLEGLINAKSEIQFHNHEEAQGYAHITLPPGKLSYPIIEGERHHWEYRGGKIDITLHNSHLAATSDIAISDKEHFKGQLTLENINILSLDSHAQQIQGNAELNINDVSLLEAIIPEINNVRGEIGLKFAVLGTLAEPRFNGNAHLNNGELRIPRLGLNIKQINLKSQSNGLDKIDYQLTARSGDGQILVQGQTKLEQQTGWPTSITMKGENFEISHIPVSQLVVSPDLKIKIQKNNINISGNVHIPYAKLQPKDVTTAARVSDDVVIVGNEQGIKEKWLMTTKVRLTLGERVNLFAFGFDGRLGGNLLLEDEPGQLTKATGEINVPEGRYAAYGQRLEIEHGRLLFSGTPITNPGLDLRAVRRTGEITTGLKVKGNLNKPKVELFSIPAMGQTDTLAYLLLGRPIEKASGDDGEMMAKAALALSLVGGDSLARAIGNRFGFDEMRVESSNSGEQASLVIGRYLSPKLYIGYGVGLIESFNTFNLRYQISDKWQLKGESGVNHGADLLYTIDR
ncbi:MAG: translocation/assembly module TamB domain-containing protein [Gammaproteobacteria bacterium]|nr:translocation/assembly module TamB domain-containing protein [Gammaproteobacteria bacterium]